jgi:hypothetical protein
MIVTAPGQLISELTGGPLEPLGVLGLGAGLAVLFSLLIFGWNRAGDRRKLSLLIPLFSVFILTMMRFYLEM